MKESIVLCSLMAIKIWTPNYHLYFQTKRVIQILSLQQLSSANEKFWIFIFKSLPIIPGILHSIEASDSKTSDSSGILDILSRSCLASPPPPSSPPLHPALRGDKKCFWKMEVGLTRNWSMPLQDTTYTSWRVLPPLFQPGPHWS